MSYRVTIEEIKKIKTTDNEYERIIGEAVAVKMFDKTGEKPEEYGYVKKETEKEIEIPVYEQTVDEIDIKAVIDAVNNK